jgi:ribosomal protein S18 acetylase RimI-like enzyme
MSEPTRVRQATGDDVGAMLAVWRDTGERGATARRAELVRVLERDPEFLLLAEIGDRVVGVIVGTTDGYWGYLKRFIVRPPDRLHGVGRALIEELERRFMARGIYRLTGQIRHGDAESMALSSALGYEHEESIMVWTKTLKPGAP